MSRPETLPEIGRIVHYVPQQGEEKDSTPEEAWAAMVIGTKHGEAGEIDLKVTNSLGQDSVKTDVRYDTMNGPGTWHYANL